ncbi:MAG: carcinine hydrolase/isopenicillin-N N-acyltransferase family protein [Rhodothermaceae bacterium]
MKNAKIVLLLLLFVFTAHSFACTSVIISGKYTKNGRPILWKHRDTESVHNRIVYVQGKKYAYQGVVNSDDIKNNQIWMGFNETGFAIMNTASFNINPTSYEEGEIKDREGEVMRLALEQCATLEDFEKFLTEMPRPMGVAANFGVIDANGGAAFYETSNTSFTKFDANDPKTAPLGYIVRSNYSYTGRNNDGYGYIRYATADKLFYDAAGQKNLSVEFILNKVTRSLKNSLLETDLSDGTYCEDKNTFAVMQDFIPRSSSASTSVIEGVKPGEDAKLTTMWTILGFQLCTFVTPTWLPESDNLPNVLVANKDNQSELNEFSLNLKKRLFPIKRGSGQKYMNLSQMMNIQDTGLLQKTFKLESQIFDRAEKMLKKWRKDGINNNEIRDFYKWIDSYVMDEYRKF